MQKSNNNPNEPDKVCSKDILNKHANETALPSRESEIPPKWEHS